MRTLLPIFVLALCASVPASGQAIRFDSTATTTSAQCVSGKQCPLLVLPGTRVNFCQGTPSTLAACLASPATAYTSAAASTPCATTAQLTPGTGGSCTATADAQGGYGAWFLPGSYGYYLRVPVTAGGGTYGPYALSIHGDSGGYTLDSLYSTLAQACTAAGAGTLAITRAWNATPAQTLACGVWFLGDGKIQTATSASVVFGSGFTCPSTQQCLDSSTNSGGSFAWTKNPIAFYPQWWGAIADGAHDATASTRSAVTAACRAVPAEVDFSAGTYLMATPNTLTTQICDGLHVRGLGFPILNYTASSGAFLTNTGHRNISVAGIQSRGTNLGGTYFILHAPGASERDCEYFDNYILYFGDGSTGAGIQINSDSGNLRIHGNVMGNLTANIAITAPTDTLDIFNNTLSTPGTSPNGPNRCVDLSGENGAATIRVQHNNMTCEGSGAVRISGDGGTYIISDNESETLLPFTNASNAAFEFLGANVVLAINNLANTHSQVGGDYSFYVADSITNSTFMHNEAVGFLSYGISVGTGMANVYDNNISSRGVSLLYSRNYIGIRQSDTGNPPGVSSGCRYSPDKNFSFCSPDATIGAFNGNQTIRSTTNAAVNLKTGVDSGAGANGRSWTQATHDGVASMPHQINPNGGGVALNGIATNSGLIDMTGESTQTGINTQTTSKSGTGAINSLTDIDANFVGTVESSDVASVFFGAYKTGYSGGPFGAAGTITNHDYVIRTNDVVRARWRAAGQFVLYNVPVNCAGQITGTVWSNAGVLQVCP